MNPTLSAVLIGVTSGLLVVGFGGFLAYHLRQQSEVNRRRPEVSGPSTNALSELREAFRDLRADVREELVGIQAMYEKNRASEKRLDRKLQEAERREEALADAESGDVAPWDLVGGEEPSNGGEANLTPEQRAFLMRRQ